MSDPTQPITTPQDPASTNPTASDNVADPVTTVGKTLEEKLGFTPAEPPTIAPAEPNITPTQSEITSSTVTSEKAEIPFTPHQNDMDTGAGFTATPPTPEEIALAQAKAEALLEGKDIKTVKPATPPTTPPPVDNSGSGNVPLEGKKKNLGNVLKIAGGLMALVLMVGALAAATGLVKIPGIGETRRYALEQGWDDIDPATQQLFEATYGSQEAAQAQYEAERAAFENLPAQQQAQVDQAWQSQGAAAATEVLQQITGTTPAATTTTTTGQGTVTSEVPQYCTNEDCTATTGQNVACSGGFCPVYRTNADGTLYRDANGKPDHLGYISEEQYKPPAGTAFVGMNSYSDYIGFYNQGATENVVVVNSEGTGTLQEITSARGPSGFCGGDQDDDVCDWVPPNTPLVVACQDAQGNTGDKCTNSRDDFTGGTIFYCENQFNMNAAGGPGCAGTKLTTMPENFCGTIQVDLPDGVTSAWISFEDRSGCEETPRASLTPGAAGTSTFVNPPNPPIPGLFCSSLDGSIASPKVGDSLTLTCTAPGAVVVDHFEFRYRIDDNASQPLVAGTAQATGGNYVGTSQMTVPAIGSYTVECRVCKTADSSQCTNWGLDQ